MSIVVPVGEGWAQFSFTNIATVKVMTFGIGLGSETDFSDRAALAENLVNAWSDTEEPEGAPFAAATMLTGWTFAGVEVFEQTSLGPVSGLSTTSHSGTASGGNVVVNTALLVNKTTALGGRMNKGRIYVPLCQVSEETLDAGGFIGSSAVANLQGRYTVAFQQSILVDAQLCVHHSDGSAGTPMTGLVVQSKVATQRRRLR